MALGLGSASMFNQAIRRNVRRSVFQSAASPPSPPRRRSAAFPPTRTQVAGLGAADTSLGGLLARPPQQSPRRFSQLSPGRLRRSQQSPQRSPQRTSQLSHGISRSPLGAVEQAGRWTAWSEEDEDDDDDEQHEGDNQRTSSFSPEEEEQLGVPLLEWLEARGL